VEQVIKVGMVGLDTSHCPAFAGTLNNPGHETHVAGARVVGAYAGGSALFSLSRSRVDGFTRQIKDEFGVRLYDSIPELANEVDAMLLESVDGRQHLEQFRQMAVGKPVYIDKPFATSSVDAQAMVELAERTHTPIMSCSALRYAAGIADLLEEGERASADGTIRSCEAFGPAPMLEDYPGLFWYGIHSAEMLFAFMGAGCRAVRCVPYPSMDLIIGEWQDGRLGVVRGTRFEGGDFGCVVHTGQGARCGIARSTPPYHVLLLRKVVEFFRTGVSPIDVRETLEIVRFLEAANENLHVH
jgi:hypothetical protein